MGIGFLSAPLVGLRSAKITRIMCMGVLGKPKRNEKIKRREFSTYPWHYSLLQKGLGYNPSSLEVGV